MSFFGGGSDLKDYWENSSLGYGSVISTALDMYVYIMVNKRFDDKIRLVYFGNELVDNVDDVKHDIIRSALKLAHIDKGIEIIYSADLPMTGVGVGLSSSSALAVGVMNALHAYKGEYVTAEQLAKEACHIEIDCVGQRIGIQDQYAVAYGGFRRYRFYSDGNVQAEPIVCNKKNIMNLKKNLMMFYTGKGRDSRKIMAEQTKSIEKEMSHLDELVRSVDAAYDHLANGDIDFWGHKLGETWEIKKQLAGGISNPDIDDMYTRAKKAGALGGKILGAGGGGFMLLYVPEDKQENVKNELMEFKLIDFEFEPMGSRIVFMED
ncbi:MAG: GHMP kinase [Lachnospiraceae bacterium]|nr:GHMP kinase [Lachnospiraceae bacterium]